MVFLPAGHLGGYMLNQQGPLVEGHFLEGTSEPEQTPSPRKDRQAHLTGPQRTPAVAEGLSLGLPTLQSCHGHQRTRARAVSPLCPHTRSPGPRALGDPSACVPSQRPAPAAQVPSSYPKPSHLGTMLASHFLSPLPTSFFPWRNDLNLALS